MTTTSGEAKSTRLEIRADDGIRIVLDGREVLRASSWDAAVADAQQRPDRDNPLLLHAGERVTVRAVGDVRSAVLASLSPHPELRARIEDTWENGESSSAGEAAPVDVGPEIDAVAWGWFAIPLDDDRAWQLLPLAFQDDAEQLAYASAW